MLKALAVIATLAAVAAVGRYVGGRRSNRAFALSLITIVMGAAAYIGYLGYYGGGIYTDIVPPHGSLRRAPVAAVIFSGDMGFHTGMGPKIAERFAADGIPVVGVNSLTFFRTRRTQRETADMIEQAARRAMALCRTDRVVLIGQSFGADMLQAGAPLLAPAVRSHVALVALVVPGETISYRASPSDLFSFENDEEDGVATGRKLGWVQTVCIYGAEETDSLCPHLTSPAVRRIALPGGHPLHGDVDGLYAVLRGAIDRAAPSR